MGWPQLEHVVDRSVVEVLTMRKGRMAALCLAAAAVTAQAHTAVADPPAQSDAGSSTTSSRSDAGASKTVEQSDAGSGKAAVQYPAASTLAKPKSTITVRVNGLRNDKGLVFVALFDSERTFDAKKALMGGQTRPSNGSAVVVLENVVPGRYAVSFIHDENENKKLDTNFLGIPTEGFGFSRDAMGTFGPPGFDATAVNVLAGTGNVVMRAKYFF
jgi:uncharacterized protein (DUF2141 family)